MTRAAMIAVVVVRVIGLGLAHADRREASVHAHAIGGIATLGDPAAGGVRARTPLAGLAARASYATHNHFQYDATLAVLATTGARFPSGTFTPAGRPPVVGPFTVASQLARVDAGVTLRLGVAWIPTVRVAGGLAVRRHGAPAVAISDPGGGGVVSGPEATGRRGALAADLSAGVALGVDHRIDRRFIVGAAVGGVASRSIWAASSSSSDGANGAAGGALRSFEATVHAAYYWYPR